jgi:hypothetical protein
MCREGKEGDEERREEKRKKTDVDFFNIFVCICINILLVINFSIESQMKILRW